jgi:thioredoxin reductase (NADPH)
LHDLKNEQEKVIDIDGFFVAIGHSPNSHLFKEYLEMDENGYIITKADSTQTNILGVFAAGDIQDSVFRQATTASGSGCMAAIEAERYLGGLEYIKA